MLDAIPGARQVRMPHRDMSQPAHILEAAFFQPILRMADAVQDTTLLGKGSVAVAGVLTFLRGDVFLMTLAIYLTAAIWDWFLGRRLAHKNDEFSSQKASEGMFLKVSMIVQLLLLWWLGNEVILAFGGEWGGIIAAIVTGFVTIDELDSVETNRTALGGRPIPGWSKLIQMLRGATDKLNLLEGTAEAPNAPVTNTEGEE